MFASISVFLSCLICVPSKTEVAQVPPALRADALADSVTVVVRNLRIDEITVYYQYQAAGRRRLGRVAPGRDETFRIPWQGAPLQLRVRIPGSGEVPTNSVDPRPEDTVELTAHGSFNPRSLRIIDP